MSTAWWNDNFISNLKSNMARMEDEEELKTSITTYFKSVFQDTHARILTW